MALSLCSPLPANPYSSVSGSKIFTFPPSDFVLPGARWLFLFAPRAPLTLVTPFRGAKSSHFRRRISTSQALGALALCSPLPANPCSSVPGSKIFTFPSPAFALSATRLRPLFAPRYPQTLVAPSRGAKSSHFRRRISTSRAPGGALSLLPPSRKPLQLRFGEQNLHTSAARFRPPRRSAALSLCSPLPVNPCSSVLGSKIFTFSPSDFDLSVARCAPSLCSPLPANPCSSVPGSKIFTLSPPALNLPGARWLYASKGATAYPRKTKVNPLRLYFFCTSLKSGHFSPQNRLFGLFPCRMKFAKKFYSAILSIRKDALGALYTCAEHARLFRQALLSSNFVLYENV